MPTVFAVRSDWDVVESGPKDADQTVLLLPGGMCSARSYAEVMAEPALKDVRLLAVTMPGNAGAPAPADFSIEAYAQSTAELAKSEGVDVLVGFSMGANVAYEMAVTDAFKGPLVLLGAAFSAPDEPAFFRAMIRMGYVLGNVPCMVIRKGVPTMIKKVDLPPERRDELVADFARNKPTDMRKGLNAYLRWLHRNDDPARRLCQAGIPTWVVHAEKHGDGGLTAHEREVLEACPHVQLVTLPGSVFFIPNEASQPVASLVVEALAAA